MKKKSALICGIIILNIGILFFLLEWSRVTDNEIAFQKTCFDKYKKEAELIIIGHCEGQSNINPYYFDQPAFNLSQRDQGPLYTKKLVQVLNQQNTPSLKKVILSINPFSFSGRHLPRPRYVRDLYLYFGIYPEFNKDLIDGVMNFSLFYDEIEKWVSHYIYKSENESFKLETKEYEYLETVGDNATLYCNGYEESNSVFDYQLTKKFYSQFIQNFDFEDKDQGRENFNSIISDLTRNNYQVYIVLGPREKSYFEYLQQENANIMLQFEKEMVLLLKKFPSVTFLDFSESTLFEKKDFFEPNILNQSGSRKFSKHLNKILKSSLVLTKNNYKSTELDSLVSKELKDDK